MSMTQNTAGLTISRLLLRTNALCYGSSNRSNSKLNSPKSTLSRGLSYVGNAIANFLLKLCPLFNQLPQLENVIYEPWQAWYTFLDFKQELCGQGRR